MIRALLLLLCLLLAGCTQKEPAVVCEYEEVYMRASEPYGSDFVVNGNMMQTQVNGHTYAFSHPIIIPPKMFVPQLTFLLLFYTILRRK